MENYNNLLKDFISKLRDDEKAENTIEKYERDIKLFMNWCYAGVNNMEKDDMKTVFNKNVLIEYKMFLKEKYHKISTINSKISSLNAFLKYFHKEYLKIKILKTQKSLFGSDKKQITKNDLRKLLNVAIKKSDKRAYYLILTIARTGIRVSEVKYITYEAIKEGKAIVDNKGKNRVVIIPRALCKELLDYCRNNKIKDGVIFRTKYNKPRDRKQIWRMMKDLCVEANVDREKVFPHNLRHLFAREYFKQNKDIVKLASILGHSSIETTRIYALETENECRESIEKLNMFYLNCKQNL